MSTPQDPMRYRAGDSDRERTAEVLRQAAGDGRISLDELDTRLTDVYAARTYAELTEITADLPPTSGAVVPLGTDEPLRLAGAGGSVVRRGRWRVPSRVVIDRKHGSVLLDFTQAEFTAEVTGVEVSMTYGSLTLILPAGATAEVDCQTNYGRVRSKVPAIRVPGKPHLVVTGQKAFGSLRVRYARPWRRR